MLICPRQLSTAAAAARSPAWGNPVIFFEAMKTSARKAASTQNGSTGLRDDSRVGRPPLPMCRYYAALVFNTLGSMKELC